jgi:hypothetical protein
LPSSSTVAAALAELRLEQQAKAAASLAPSVLAVERAARAVEDLLSGLLAGGPRIPAISNLASRNT